MSAYLLLRHIPCLQDAPDNMEERETGRQSPIGSTGEEEEEGGKGDQDTAGQHSGSEEGGR